MAEIDVEREARQIGKKYFVRTDWILSEDPCVNEIIALCRRIRDAQREEDAKKCDAAAENLREALPGRTETIDAVMRMQMGQAKQLAATIRGEEG